MKAYNVWYKTRPNSVITPTGEIFDYAPPEETAQFMGDLVQWYRAEEQNVKFKAEELAAIFHYRYIRIHPFEDGNGRIARLLVNYILLRRNYPMIVIRTDDRDNYLKALHQCDQLTGKIPYDGANASLEQVKPLVDYISAVLENKLATLISFVKGEIPSFIEASDDTVVSDQNVSLNVSANVSVKTRIIELIAQKPNLTVKEMAQILSLTERTIYRQIDILKTENRIERIGSDKTGYWKVK
jgi:Fic family protein